MVYQHGSYLIPVCFDHATKGVIRWIKEADSIEVLRDKIKLTEIGVAEETAKHKQENKESPKKQKQWMWIHSYGKWMTPKCKIVSIRDLDLQTLEDAAFAIATANNLKLARNFKTDRSWDNKISAYPFEAICTAEKVFAEAKLEEILLALEERRKERPLKP